MRWKYECESKSDVGVDDIIRLIGRFLFLASFVLCIVFQVISYVFIDYFSEIQAYSGAF